MSWCMGLQRNGVVRREVELLRWRSDLTHWDCVCFKDGVLDFLYWRCAYAMDLYFHFKFPDSSFCFYSLISLPTYWTGSRTTGSHFRV